MRITTTLPPEGTKGVIQVSPYDRLGLSRPFCPLLETFDSNVFAIFGEQLARRSLWPFVVLSWNPSFVPFGEPHVYGASTSGRDFPSPPRHPPAVRGFASVRVYTAP